jgi:hypothetical protein
MALFASLRKSSRPSRQPLVRLYDSHQAVELARPAMKHRDLYLASVSEIAGGDVRAVWAPGKRHELKASCVPAGNA